MGILDQYVTEEDKEELSKNLKLPPKKAEAVVNTHEKNPKTSVSEKKKQTKKIKPSESREIPINEDLESIINDFNATYKQSDKTGRMIRIQDAHYRKLVALRADGISVSEFISFAVHLTLKSKDYDIMINHLKH